MVYNKVDSTRKCIKDFWQLCFDLVQ